MQRSLQFFLQLQHQLQQVTVRLTLQMRLLALRSSVLAQLVTAGERACRHCLLVGYVCVQYVPVTYGITNKVVLSNGALELLHKLQ
jgi:hypothetical protein